MDNEQVNKVLFADKDKSKNDIWLHFTFSQAIVIVLKIDV